MRRIKERKGSPSTSPSQQYFPNKDYYMSARGINSHTLHRQINGKNQKYSKSKIRCFSLASHGHNITNTKPNTSRISKETSRTVKRTRSSTVLFAPKKVHIMNEPSTNSLETIYHRLVKVFSFYQGQYKKLKEKNQNLKATNKKLKKRKKPHKK